MINSISERYVVEVFIKVIPTQKNNECLPVQLPLRNAPVTVMSKFRFSRAELTLWLKTCIENAELSPPISLSGC